MGAGAFDAILSGCTIPASPFPPRNRCEALMRSFLKQVAWQLPPRFQQTLKRRHFALQIRRGRFDSPEPEYGLLETWVGVGDLVLDLGANIGHYTLRLCDIVGPEGRVIALEPVPRTFELLVANMGRREASNATLLNAAASDETALLRMAVPRLSTGGDNYYRAHVTDGDEGIGVLGIPVDSLRIPRRVSLVKIDVEGHEMAALKGMELLLRRDHPVLIVEGRSGEVGRYLTGLGYGVRELDGSPNRVFLSRGAPIRAE